MKDNFYWFDLQFYYYMYTEIVGKVGDEYEVYEYEIKNNAIHVAHVEYSEERMNRTRGKITGKMGGYRDAFIALFDAPRFEYVAFNSMGVISEIDIIIDRKEK